MENDFSNNLDKDSDQILKICGLSSYQNKQDSEIILDFLIINNHLLINYEYNYLQSIIQSLFIISDGVFDIYYKLLCIFINIEQTDDMVSKRLKFAIIRRFKNDNIMNVIINNNKFAALSFIENQIFVFVFNKFKEYLIKLITDPNCEEESEFYSKKYVNVFLLFLYNNNTSFLRNKWKFMIIMLINDNMIRNEVIENGTHYNWKTWNGLWWLIHNIPKDEIELKNMIVYGKINTTYSKIWIGPFHRQISNPTDKFMLENENVLKKKYLDWDSELLKFYVTK